MRTPLRVGALAATLLVALATGLNRAETPLRACGPFIEFTLFTSPRAPEDPSYYSGNLGIFQPGYDRRYLLVAWRTLSGHPLTPAERLAYAPATGRTPQDVPVDPVRVWLDARRSATAESGPSAIPREGFVGSSYSYILNCADSAFLTAAETLKSRQMSPAYSPEDLLAWIAAQDEVFGNCGVPLGNRNIIPAPAKETAAPLVRADRAYQIAAAMLYAGRYSDAEAAFTAIGNHHDSPWSAWGPYLAARAMIREGTLGGKDSAGDPAALARAERALDQVVETGPSSIRDSARGLLQYVGARLRPMKALGTVAREIETPEVDSAVFARRLGNFTWLMDRVPYSDAVKPPDSELVDWIMTVQKRIDDPVTHAVQRWHATHSEAWLVAALMNAAADDPKRSELIAAAAGVTAGSAAYPAATFHRARLMLLTGSSSDARAVLDAALSDSHLPVSTVNQLRAARMQTARTLDEFLEDAVRTPVSEPAPALDADAVDVLNERLPLSVLGRVAANRTLPDRLRPQVLTAILARAILLGDAGAVRQVLPRIRRFVPQLAAALSPLESAADDRELLNEGWGLLLSQPGLRPFVPLGTFREPGDYSRLDSLRDNWWCTFQPAKDEATPYMTEFWRRGGARWGDVQRVLYASPVSLPAAHFLTSDESRAQRDEWARLVALDAAPTELERHAIAWAEAHPDSRRAPHVLAQAVQAGHLGCGDATTWPLSKKAFALLHQRYPASIWAQKTPYWYK